jgi:hypothetical protein
LKEVTLIDCVSKFLIWLKNCHFHLLLKSMKNKGQFLYSINQVGCTILLSLILRKWFDFSRNMSNISILLLLNGDIMIFYYLFSVLFNNLNNWLLWQFIIFLLLLILTRTNYVVFLYFQYETLLLLSIFQHSWTINLFMFPCLWILSIALFLLFTNRQYQHLLLTLIL